MRISERICKYTLTAFAVITSIFGTISAYSKITGLTMNGSSVAAAGLSMAQPGGASDFDKTDSLKHSDTDTDADTAASVQIKASPDAAESDKDDHIGEETYLVTESLFRESNASYDNFYVKNSTDKTLDLRGYLSSALPFEYEETTAPQVLIVHTHSTEAYMDSDLGYYYESFSPGNVDDSKNIVRVGDAITESIEEEGIAVIHCKKHHDEPSYLGAYDSSAESINEYLAEYPSIKIVLDIHRDSITTDENEKIKPTFTCGGKKAAQIMIMCGNDNNGYYDFPDWEQNMSLAVKLQSVAETDYPGMTRPLYFGDFMYNMNLAPGSLLIEMGTDANTLDEAVYSGEMLGKVIAKVLKAAKG